MKAAAHPTPVASEVHEAVLSVPLFEDCPKLGIRIHGHALCGIDFLAPEVADKLPTTVLGQQIVAQLLRYFADPHWVFSLPLAMQGTVFQKRIWQALRVLPPGATCSYGELAGMLGTGARAIGNACRANPLPIVIPCHRVLARQGLGGYSGAVSGETLEIKRRLLAHERPA